MGGRHGDIHWTELQTRDAPAAAAFYASVLGWEIEQIAMGDGRAPYTLFRNAGKPVAGVFTMEGAQFDGMAPHWFTFIAVDDVDRTAEAVVAAGGRVHREPFDVPTVGRIAIVADPTGAVVGMMTPAA